MDLFKWGTVAKGRYGFIPVGETLVHVIVDYYSRFIEIAQLDRGSDSLLQEHILETWHI